LGIGFSDGNAYTVQVLALVTASGTSPTLSSGASKRRVAPRQSSGAICSPSSIPANTPQIALTFAEPTSATVSSPGPVTLQVTATNGCGAPVTDGPVYVEFSTPASQPADPRVFLQPSATAPGVWEGSWPPVTLGAVRLRARGQSQSQTNTLIGASDFLYETVPAPAATAAPLANGVINAASATPNLNVGRGSLVSIYGQRMVGSTLAATKIPLPTQLGDTQVTLGDALLPLLFAAPGQINALIPLRSLETDVQLPLVVQTNAGGNGLFSSTPTNLTVVDFQPAIFSQDARGTGPGSIQDVNYHLVTESNKVKVGDYILIYCTGLGAVNNPPAVEGGPAPSPPNLATTLQTPTVTFGEGANAITVTNVYFSGLTPGFAGLYQVDVQIPQGVQPGDVDVSLSIGGQTSNTVTVAVQ